MLLSINNFQNYKNAVSVKTILFLILLLPFYSFSQTTLLNDTIVDVPKSLRVNEIANYGQQSRLLINKTQKLIENKEELIKIKENLSKHDSLVFYSLNILRDTLTNFNLDQLDKMEDQMNLINSKVDPWTKQVGHWKKKTIDYKKNIEFDFETWSKTSDYIKVEEKGWIDADSSQILTFNRVKDQVNLNLNSILSIKTEMIGWNMELNNVENSLTVSKGELNEVFSLISSKRAYSLNNIWIPEYAPIWKQNTAYTTQEPESSLKQKLIFKIQTTKNYLSENLDFFYISIFCYLLILSWVLYLKIKTKKIFDKNSQIIEKGKFLLNHPLISSFIIFAFILFLFFDIPIELKYAMLIILITPFSKLIWDLNTENRTKHITLFILFSLLFVALPIAAESPKSLRYALLLINIFTFSLLFYFQKQKELINKENPYWLGTLDSLIIIFMFLSGIAFITNIIGSVQLSLILTRTIIGTFLTFTLIKEAVLLTESFIYLMLMGPLFKFSNILKDDSKLVLEFINKAMKIGGFLLWIYIVFDLLKIQQSFINTIIEFINSPLVVGELSISIGNILAFFIILQVSIWISKFIRYFLDKEVYPRTHISEGVSSTFSLMIKYTIMFVGFLFALFGAGIELSKVAVGIGALGVGVGFGLQNIVNNFVSGIILALERPIKIGDVVKVDDVEGVVENIGLRASQIRTWDGSDVLVPNGALISGKLTNRTFSDKLRRLDIELQLDKDTDIQKASNVILNTTRSIPEIMTSPEPFYNFIGIKNGKAVIMLYGWIDNYSNGVSIGTKFKIEIFEALKREGFKISFPILQIKETNKESV